MKKFNGKLYVWKFEAFEEFLFEAREDFSVEIRDELLN